MAEKMPPEPLVETVAQQAVVAGVVGSFGPQCVLVQSRAFPHIFAVFSDSERPQMICCHSNLRYDIGGWRKNGEAYDIDDLASTAIALMRDTAASVGQPDIDVNVIHVVDEEPLGEEQSFSAWPVVGADPMAVAQAIESEARVDIANTDAATLDRMARRISEGRDGANDRPEGGVASLTAESPPNEVIVSAGGDQLSLERILRIPNVYDAAMRDIIRMALTSVGITSFSCGSESIDVDELLTPAGVFPAIVIAAAQRWGLILVDRPNMPGFFIRLRTDPGAALEFRIDGIHSNSPASLALSVLQVLQPNTDAQGDCNIDTLIDIYSSWLDMTGVRSTVGGEGSAA